MFENLNVPVEWKNSFTKYPHGLTIFEAICEWSKQVDLMIDHLNLTQVQIDKLFTDTLPENISNVLDEWYLNGKLSTLINNDLLISKADKSDFDDFKKDKITIAELLRKYLTTAWTQALTYRTLIINQTVTKTGTYVIPEGQTIVFENNAELLQNDDLPCLLASNSNWKILGSGKIKKNWTAPLAKVAGSVGIVVNPTSFDWTIGGNIRIERFADSGIKFEGGGIVESRTGNMQISNLHCFENWDNYTFIAGFPMEYLTLSNCLSTYAKNKGCYLETGNINWTGGAIIHNNAGLHVRQPDNGANAHHGMFTGVHINHNNEYAIWAEKVAYGEDFIGCHFYDNNVAGMGAIKLDNCRGINILDGTIGCNIEYLNDGHIHVGYNRIAGNKIDRERAVITGVGYDRTKLIVEDNFDVKGLWSFNDVAKVYAQKYLGADQVVTGAVSYGLMGIDGEISDNRNALGASFVAPFKANYITSLLSRLVCSQAFTTEYLTFERDDLASGSFTELYRVNLADLKSSAGTAANINFLYEFVVSGGGQFIIYLKGCIPAASYTFKTGTLLTIKTNN